MSLMPSRTTRGSSTTRLEMRIYVQYVNMIISEVCYFFNFSPILSGGASDAPLQKNSS